MCQLDSAPEYPDIWSNIILSVSVKVFVDEMNLRTDSLSKADCTHYCGWAPSNQLKARIEQKGWTGENFFCLTAYKLRYQFSPLSRLDISSLPAFRLKLHYQLSWVFSLHAHPADLGICKPLQSPEPNIYTHPVSLENPNTGASINFIANLYKNKDILSSLSCFPLPRTHSHIFCSGSNSKNGWE